MILMKIQSVVLHKDADTQLTARAYAQVKAWLGQWTTDGNIMAVVSESRDDAVAALLADASGLIPSWLYDIGLRAHHLEVVIAYTEVNKDGRFWVNAWSRFTTHRLPEQP